MRPVTRHERDRGGHWPCRRRPRWARYRGSPGAGGLIVGDARRRVHRDRRPAARRGPPGPARHLPVPRHRPCPCHGHVRAADAGHRQDRRRRLAADLFPLPGRSEGWVQSPPLTLDGSVAERCQWGPARSPSPPSCRRPLGPGESFTAVDNNPPSPEPSAAPSPDHRPHGDAERQALARRFDASTSKISYDTPPTARPRSRRSRSGHGRGQLRRRLRHAVLAGAGRGLLCPGADDPGYRYPNNGTWQVTLDTKADDITNAGKLAYYAVATERGETGRIPAERRQHDLGRGVREHGAGDHVSQVFLGLFVVLGPAGRQVRAQIATTSRPMWMTSTGSSPSRCSTSARETRPGRRSR